MTPCAQSKGRSLLAEFPVSPQYCSLNDPDGFANFHLGPGLLDVARAEGEVAHLALDAAGIAAIAAGDNTFLKDLVENRVMKSSPLLRGE